MDRKTIPQGSLERNRADRLNLPRPCFAEHRVHAPLPHPDASLYYDAVRPPPRPPHDGLLLAVGLWRDHDAPVAASRSAQEPVAMAPAAAKGLLGRWLDRVKTMLSKS